MLGWERLTLEWKACLVCVRPRVKFSASPNKITFFFFLNVAGLDMVRHVFNLSSWKADADAFLGVQGHHGLPIEF